VVTAPDIPGHRVGGVLGAGGFATVYRCWQLTVGREVAVKVDNRVLLTERDRRRFFREVTRPGGCPVIRMSSTSMTRARSPTGAPTW